MYKVGVVVVVVRVGRDDVGEQVIFFYSFTFAIPFALQPTIVYQVEKLIKT